MSAVSNKHVVLGLLIERPGYCYDVQQIIDHLVHLAAVSEAFPDGARHALWFIEPELARSAQVVAGLARDGAGDPPADER